MPSNSLPVEDWRKEETYQSRGLFFPVTLSAVFGLGLQLCLFCLNLNSEVVSFEAVYVCVSCLRAHEDRSLL